MTDYLAKYEEWLDRADSDTKKELAAIREDDEAIRARFTAPLEFGTAGLRGILCAGIGAMNRYTVGSATQGLAELILEKGRAKDGVVISYDSRHHSEEFARLCAAVLAANGIRVYLFPELHPTPVLSFAVRDLACVAGINITASHNPKEYNGYKAYWEDGAQLSPELAAVVSEHIRAIDPFSDVKTVDFEKAVADGRIEMLGDDIDERYLAAVAAQAVYPGILERVPDMSVVYTPLHGAGYRLVPEILRRIGVKKLVTVPSQMVPDGDFPTAPSPNPEYAAVFEEGIALARQQDCDLIIANDPDADRVGIMVQTRDDTFITLTGNQVGALLLDYIITALEERGAVPSDPYVIKTIVSTEIVTRICEAHHLTLHNVLTGFKFIGEVIKTYEAAGHGSFILGFEESYGYLKGTYARDKDAVVATMLIAEMAAYYKTKNMTLYDALLSLYERYGTYREKTESIYFPGPDGIAVMKERMADRRKALPETVGGVKVTAVRDYLAGTVTDRATGAVTPTGLPASDVLYYELEGGDRVIIRPSGTEPKIKIYCLVGGKDAAECDARIERYFADARSWAE